MSIEAMKQVIELYDKHCYNNDYGGIEFNNRYGYKFIEAIEALRAAIHQAEAQQPATPEPVVDVRCEGCGYMTHHREHMGCVRSAKQHTRPAPSVPDEKPLPDLMMASYHEAIGWNACRAAMLAAK